MICIDRTGKEYPCHIFMPSTSGNNTKLDDIFRLLESDNLLDIQCDGCTLVSFCPTCYGMNYVETSDITKRNKGHCVFSKIRAKATAYLLSHMLANKQRRYIYLDNKSEGDIFNMIKAIEVISKEIEI